MFEKIYIDFDNQILTLTDSSFEERILFNSSYGEAVLKTFQIIIEIYSQKNMNVGWNLYLYMKYRYKYVGYKNEFFVFKKEFGKCVDFDLHTSKFNEYEKYQILS